MNFRVADHIIQISIKESPYNKFGLIPSFAPFRISEEETIDENDILFTMLVDDSISVAETKESVGEFDLGDGKVNLWRLEDGGYEYSIFDLKERECCLLQTDKSFRHCRCALKGDRAMRRLGLNDALMFAFAFAGSRKQTLLIHASTILHEGYGYPFIAKSGTGKSTHSQLWIKHIPGSELMNDDNPSVRIIDGKPIIYGTPWSGKTPCYRQIKAPLGAITRIDRAKENSIERLDIAQSFASFLPSCSAMQWDREIYDGICQTITGIIATTPFYTLHCLPDEDAARLCHKTISRTSK